ncbi:MAG: NfeD family protein [Eubacteriales bacterium]
MSEFSLPIFWVLLLLLLGLVEIFTQGLATIWFCGGALVAAVCAIVGFTLPVQIAVFISVSIVLLIFTRPIAMKKFNPKTIPTNVEALVGKIGIVTEKIQECDTGQVRLNGLEWTAVAEDDSVIEKNTKVLVKKIEGVKLVVAKIDK